MSTPYITIPATLGRGVRLIITPSYVTNGHWAIAKARLTNGGLFATQTSVEAYMKNKPTVMVHEVDTIVASINDNIGETKKYIGTTFLEQVGKVLKRFFVQPETGELVAFDVAYLKLLGKDNKDAELWGAPGKPFRDTELSEDMGFVVMPTRFTGTDIVKVFGTTVMQATDNAKGETE